MACINISKVKSTSQSFRLAELLHSEYGFHVDHIVATKIWEGPLWTAYGVYKSGRRAHIMSMDTMADCLQYGVDLIDWDEVAAKDEQWQKSLDAGHFRYRGNRIS